MNPRIACNLYLQVTRAAPGRNHPTTAQRASIYPFIQLIAGAETSFFHSLPLHITRLRPPKMSRPAPSRNLTLTEELEKLEQSITLTLQEIDHNFSKAHRIVTTNILPLVEQYGEHSKNVWEASKVSQRPGRMPRALPSWFTAAKSARTVVLEAVLRGLGQCFALGLRGVGQQRGYHRRQRDDPTDRHYDHVRIPRRGCCQRVGGGGPFLQRTVSPS